MMTVLNLDPNNISKVNQTYEEKCSAVQDLIKAEKKQEAVTVASL